MRRSSTLRRAPGRSDEEPAEAPTTHQKWRVSPPAFDDDEECGMVGIDFTASASIVCMSRASSPALVVRHSRRRITCGQLLSNPRVDRMNLVIKDVARRIPVCRPCRLWMVDGMSAPADAPSMCTTRPAMGPALDQRRE